MKTTRWAGQALDDLANVDDFYAEIDPRHADLIGLATVRAARFLAEHPHAGPMVEDHARKWRVPGTKFVLIYHVIPEGIEILRVHHGRENWRRS